MSLLDLPTIRRTSDPPSFIDGLLAEQQRLTAVERFARLHEAGEVEEPAHAKYYRDLLPLTAPRPGEQYAFTVDLDACSGCKACVTACHSLNGLDESETFRDVGGLIGRDRCGLHVLQHVTTACHHCLEPACLTGCPTLAYDKDPVTGIVRHLDDQCIGCQYCVLMCPYEVPKYNAAKGIVRKCDMCRQRLEGGEAPACVQACPNQAIRIEVVSRTEIQQRANCGEFLPAAPDPRITLPTTRFVSKRQPLLDVAAAGASHERPTHAHLPLVVMLVLTQMSVGMFCLAQVLRLLGADVTALVVAAAAIGLIGQQAAVLHLGRPTIAWRAWLGWRTSWLSREIIAFGAFSAAAVAYISAIAIYGGRGAYPAWLGLATCISGIAGVYCSAMIYVATQREYWSAGRTIPRFLLTALLLGLGGALATQAIMTGEPPAKWLVALLIATAVLRLCRDIADFKELAAPEDSLIRRSIDLLTGPLHDWVLAQAVAVLVGGVLLPIVLLGLARPPLVFVLLSPALLVVAELIQRGLFFAAAASPRMPGVSHT